MALTLQRSKVALWKALNDAAKSAGLSLQNGHMACAVTRGGAVANALIAGADVSPKALSRGTDILFVYAQLPAGVGKRLPKGLTSDYYVVNISATGRKPTATLRSVSRPAKVIALPLLFTPDRDRINLPKGPAHIRTSAHSDNCGYHFDVFIRWVGTYEIHLGWC